MVKTVVDKLAERSVEILAVFIAGLIAWKAVTEYRIMRLEQNADAHAALPAHFDGNASLAKMQSEIHHIKRGQERIADKLDRLLLQQRRSALGGAE